MSRRAQPVAPTESGARRPAPGAEETAHRLAGRERAVDGEGFSPKTARDPFSEPAEEAAAPVGEQPGAGTGEMILVVDDEPTIRDVCSETLESFGYRALTAADGAEAVALFARHGGEVAAVVTDLAMPIMDGPAAIRSIRRLSRLVPILAMSGRADRHGIEEIEEYGISAFLTKPFSAADLLLRLGEALASQRAS